MMPAPRSALDWEGQTILDRDGDRVGRIEEIFLVEETGRPEWALVRLGRLKSRTTLVPLTDAKPGDDGIRVGFGKDLVADAPPIEADSDEPSEREVSAVYRHYGIDEGGPSTNGNAGAVSNGASHGDLRDAPVGEVVKRVSDEARTLLGQEARLAKAEMTGKVKDVGIGAGMFGGAGYVAHLAALGLMLTIVFALATAIDAWLAALIVTVVLAATATALVFMGRKRIQNAGPPVPEQAIESIRHTVDTVKEEAKWGLGQTSR
jgi:sporulation protein YlmC with PRC-barrel domain